MVGDSVCETRRTVGLSGQFASIPSRSCTSIASSMSRPSVRNVAAADLQALATIAPAHPERPQNSCKLHATPHARQLSLSRASSAQRSLQHVWVPVQSPSWPQPGAQVPLEQT